ncbi:integral membrane protein [Erysiphe neolycopersici]|uniref:Integral membrane protein n=1 Tax=Erysiphe neolycopersici TaxID=212602 RepID=A0A420HWT7_9PEZI|nr:integral membrane protein [Erysiphe neolycopersici]
MEISLPRASSSLDPVPYSIRNGMIVLGICGLLSLLLTVGFFLYFTYRMIYWQRYSAHSLARTQVFMLIYNLFIADIFQALSFVISFWWVSKDKLVGPNMTCDIQGLLIQIGDVASGLWALAIAVHTFLNIVAQKTIAHRTFITLVVLLWSFIMILAALGPLRGAKDFFVPAGAWCWVNKHNHSERLYLHYMWIFMSELGSVALYTFMFFYLRFRIKTSTPSKTAAHSAASSFFVKIFTSQNKPPPPPAESTTIRPNVRNVKSVSATRTYILKSSRHMVVYTLAYIALTLPLAAGRALSMAGIEPPIIYFTAAGILIACSGFVDVALYVGTRRLLVTSCLNRETIDERNENRMKPLLIRDSEGNEIFTKKITYMKTLKNENSLAQMDTEIPITKTSSYRDDSEVGKAEWPV